MKKMVLAMAAGVAMLAGSAVTNGPTGTVSSSDVVVRSASASATQQQAPAPTPTQKKAVRETRADARVRYWRGVPAAIKNRAGGERAHRRWRKVKASGLRAA